MSEVYDRHEYIKDLTGAGLNEKQAEAIIKCQSASQSKLATKADLIAEVAKLEASTREAIAELKTAMAEQEAKLEGRIGKLEGRIGKLEWMLGFNLALTAAVLLALIFR